MFCKAPDRLARGRVGVGFVVSIASEQLDIGQCPVCEAEVLIPPMRSGARDVELHCAHCGAIWVYLASRPVQGPLASVAPPVAEPDARDPGAADPDVAGPVAAEPAAVWPMDAALPMPVPDSGDDGPFRGGDLGAAWGVASDDPAPPPQAAALDRTDSIDSTDGADSADSGDGSAGAAAPLFDPADWGVPDAGGAAGGPMAADPPLWPATPDPWPTPPPAPRDVSDQPAPPGPIGLAFGPEFDEGDIAPVLLDRRPDDDDPRPQDDSPSPHSASAPAVAPDPAPRGWRSRAADLKAGLPGLVTPVMQPIQGALSKVGALLPKRKTDAPSLRLTCPSCGTTYRVRPADAVPGGRVVRCSRCSHEWRPTSW